MSGIIAQNTLDSSGLIKSPEGGGAWNFIKKLTGSGTSDLSFVDGTSGVDLSTYKAYVFTFNNMHPSTESGGVEFQFNMSTDGGSNYNVTKTTTSHYAFHTEADDDTTFGYDTAEDHAEGTGFQALGVSVGTDNDQGCSGTLWIFNPASTTFTKNFLAVSMMNNSADTAYNRWFGGFGNTTSAVDAVRFQMSSGNIDLGQICLYGISNA